MAHLAGVLADSSSTPDASWYCVWSGYGGLDELEELAIAIQPRDGVPAASA